MKQTGLTSEEVRIRKDRGQVNKGTGRLTRSVTDIVKANTFTYFNLINTILFVLVIFTDQEANSFFYMTVIFNTCIGIWQEVKAKKILDRMHILIEEKISVLRDAEWQEVMSEDLVLGDHIRLKAGMQIPADAVITDGYLEVNEAIITGESYSLIRRTGDTVLAGTVVTSGDAQADLIRVGADNFSETIMKDARKYAPADSVLQNDLQKMLRIISVVIIPMGILLYTVQKVQIGLGWRTAVLKTISAIIGMIPEGLVVLTSISLAAGVIRLSRRSVLVQDLYSIESLARIDVLCMDKTGTLTKGVMAVQKVIPYGDTDMDRIRDIMGSYVRIFEKNANATDKALLAYFDKNDFYAETSVLPFSSERKYAGVSFGEEGTFFLGAMEFLFPNDDSKLRDLAAEDIRRGCRIVALAHSSDTEVSQEDLSGITLEPLALFVISDVLRDNAADIIRYFVRQGVALKVISGDDPLTASALAVQAGIPNASDSVDMSMYKERIPEEVVLGSTVFGRVLPDQKKEMIGILQKNGHHVAMVGDGVNDVMALKKAEVGIVMGSGVQAARDSGNIILLDNDFAHVPGIVNEGRRVINNIGRAASMYLVKTVFSFLLSMYVIFLGRDYPFLPIHLSLISAFGVGIPTFLLQMEPSYERVKANFLSRAFRNALPTSLIVFIAALAVDLLKEQLMLSAERENTIMIILTMYAYLYTLFKVYFPPDRKRAAVILCMGLGLACGLVVLAPILHVQMRVSDLLVILPAGVIVPVLIALVTKLQEAVVREYRKYRHRVIFD